MVGRSVKGKSGRERDALAKRTAARIKYLKLNGLDDYTEVESRRAKIMADRLAVVESKRIMELGTGHRVSAHVRRGKI